MVFNCMCNCVYYPSILEGPGINSFMGVPLAHVLMLQVDPIRQRLQEAALTAAEGRLLLLVRSPYCLRG